MADLVARLDGLPLAIELAAAQCDVLHPSELLGAIQHVGLDAFASEARDAPVRHRTLRNAIAWSHDLLDAREQTLFHRLAVFAGDFSLSAVAAVVEPPTTARSPGRVLEELAALVRKSLLERQPDASRDTSDEPRFRMLAVIRDYALEQLDSSGEGEDVRRRHAEHYLALAERARREFEGPDQRAWLCRLEAAHVELRAAMSWLVDSGQVAMALRGDRGYSPRAGRSLPRSRRGPSPQARESRRFLQPATPLAWRTRSTTLA